MKVIEYSEQGFYSTVRVADEGCLLIEGYDMDTIEFYDEVTYQQFDEYIIKNWDYLSMCICVVSNSRGEIMEFDF